MTAKAAMQSELAEKERALAVFKDENQLAIENERKELVLKVAKLLEKEAK